jgi:uncharacterized membrane protein (UPF0127 family)
VVSPRTPLLALIGSTPLLVLLVPGACADEGLDVVTKSGAHHYSVEIAADEPTRERGLMYRRQMPEDHGMLFEFERREPVFFWMKNTYLPLDMLFIDRDGTVASVFADATPMSEAMIPSGAPVVAVLELNAGQAKAIGVKPGDKVKAAFFKH